MLKVLITAYTGFFCARKESERLVHENPRTIIHTGFGDAVLLGETVSL